ncbi:MAG: MFS transporter [Anaerolineae bacterium]|jgi:glycoside/pentoside/hexuronide:cation symporter, GPH family
MATSSSEAQSRLSRTTKLAYGVGDLGPAIVTAINGFFLNAFLLDVAGLRPAAVGVIFLIVKIWDSVNDPLVGSISDRTNTRWGRRRPWLLFGAVPFGLAFLLQWLVPPLGAAGKFWYYLIVAFLLDAGFTAVNVPYTALTAELTKDYDERTVLNSYRFSFSIVGGMVAAFLHGVIVVNFDSVLIGYAVSAAIWTFFIISSNFVTFAFTSESDYSETADEGPGFVAGLRIVFSNRAFIIVTVIYLMSWLCIQFVQANLLLYVRYWIGAEDQFPMMILAVQVSTFLFLLFWAWVSGRIGKKNIYYVGMTFWVVVEIALFFVQPGQVTLLFVLAFLAGGGVSIGYLVPWSMLPDVIELDELETGQRREGVYYGFFVFLQKLGISIGLAISNFALEATGYINQEVGGPIPVQPDGVKLALRVFVSLVPAVVLLLSFPVVKSFPIDRERHAAIKAELEKRQVAG